MRVSGPVNTEITGGERMPQEPVRGARVNSIDIIRGAVMVLMAIDHVRVFSGLPAGGPTPGIFFTRWVTHFCAPAFVFLAGTSAFLYGEKLRDAGQLSRFLLTHGAWLVVLELTFLRVAWTFNVDYRHYLLAGVIWAIGWCMILMAGLVRLPLGAVASVGLVIIAGHNIVDFFRPHLLAAQQTSASWWIWNVLYFGFTDGRAPQLGATGPQLVVLYSIVPWIGVMAAGFAFGAVVRMDAATRRRTCLRIGLGALALFIALRASGLYGNPTPGSQPTPMPSWLAFLNTTKYPASLLFLLMTLGPTIALIPLLENARGPAARVLTVFGRVPLSYYLIHIPIIHGVALIVSLLRLGSVSPWLFTNHPMMNPSPPEGYTWGLPLLYLVTVLVVTGLYFPCTWFAQLKARRPGSVLRYL